MKSAKATPLDGPHKELFADGGLSGEGRVRDGKRHGKWTWYYKNGGLKAVGAYAEVWCAKASQGFQAWRANGSLIQTPKKPPSTTSSVPTAYADSSDPRNTAAFAISSGLPKRPTGSWARIEALICWSACAGRPSFP